MIQRLCDIYLQDFLCFDYALPKECSHLKPFPELPNRPPGTPRARAYLDADEGLTSQQVATTASVVTLALAAAVMYLLRCSGIFERALRYKDRANAAFEIMVEMQHQEAADEIKKRRLGSLPGELR
jgi:hypothetical protein